MDRSYSAFVQTMAKKRPSLKPLAKPLSEMGRYQQDTSKAITCLEVRDERAFPFQGTSLEQVLGRIREFKEDASARDTGLCVLIEDIHSSEVAALGALLDVDPRFFRDHFATSHFPHLEKELTTDLMSSLPSRSCSKDVGHLQYQRVIDLGEISLLRKVPYQLRMTGNLRRQVRRVPPLSGRCLGLVRACFSISLTKLEDERWICLMLMDPTTADVVSDSFNSNNLYLPGFKTNQVAYRIYCNESETLPTFSSFRQDSQCENDPQMTLIQEVAKSLMDLPSQSLKGDLSIIKLAQHPIRIIISEWTLYSLLMGRYMRLYEFSTGMLQKQISNKGDDQIMELYQWRRRSQQSLNKLRATRLFITHQPAQSQVSDLLVKDIDYVSNQIEKYQGTLEGMVPILTSTIQLIDSCRAMTETVYVKRLTYIALVFLPLSYVASVFSMNDDFAINSRRFWIYLITAFPLLALVLILSSIPSQWTNLAGY
ncbi:hypothetical protein B0J14DRAFT_605292 [Halenospora varia]|nr:hypothetical protein B0J14DRAFT_605292 [Halenospora varia]